MTTIDTLTDDQIATLRAESAAAGDLLTVAICDVALAGELDRIADVDEHLAELERLGIIPSHIDADVQARREIVRVIREAEAMGARTDAAWWDWHDADSSRWSADTATAEDRCAAWVEGTSDDGPEVG